MPGGLPQATWLLTRPLLGPAIWALLRFLGGGTGEGVLKLQLPTLL